MNSSRFHYSQKSVVPKFSGSLTLNNDIHKRIIMRTLLFILAAVLMTSTANAQFFEAWPSKIKFKTKSIDIGNVKKGTVEKIAFPFINDGTEPLIIAAHKGGTADLNIILPKGPIEPGEKSKIIVEFKVSGTGNFKEKFGLETNAQKKPIILELYGIVD